MNVENKIKKGFNELKKCNYVFSILCFIFLILTNCTSHKEPDFSTSPNKVPDGVLMIPILKNGIDADFFHGTLTKSQKVIIMLGGSEGGRMWSYQPQLLHDLIDQGFCILSLPYFGTDNLPKNLKGIPIEYFKSALNWLSTQNDLVIPNDYALLGVSRGAELALILGSRFPEIKAIVAIAPSSVVFPGPPTSVFKSLGKQHSAWSENGQELPFVHIPFTFTTLKGMITGKRTRMFEKALQDTVSVQLASIPVEKTQGPILLVSFLRDQVWPSRLMSEQIMKRLKDNNFQFFYNHTTYDGTHSEWSIETCRKNILTFLKERFLNSESPK